MHILAVENTDITLNIPANWGSYTGAYHMRVLYITPRDKDTRATLVDREAVHGYRYVRAHMLKARLVRV
jgi:hypothetical protein